MTTLTNYKLTLFDDDYFIDVASQIDVKWILLLVNLLVKSRERCRLQVASNRMEFTLDCALHTRPCTTWQRLGKRTRLDYIDMHVVLQIVNSNRRLDFQRLDETWAAATGTTALITKARVIWLFRHCC